MDITEVRIKLMSDPNDRLQAFCSITFDSMFVIRDLKIIQGTRGPFVAMPSRKLTDRCSGCGHKNELRARFCSQCGAQLQQERAYKDDDGRARLYADIAHPINSRCRELIQTEVLRAFEKERVQAKRPDYVCRYDDFGEEEFAQLVGGADEQHAPQKPPNPSIGEQNPEPVSATSSNDVMQQDIEDGPGVSHRLDPANQKTPSTGMHQPESRASSVQSSEDVFGAGLE